MSIASEVVEALKLLKTSDTAQLRKNFKLVKRTYNKMVKEANKDGVVTEEERAKIDELYIQFREAAKKLNY